MVTHLKKVCQLVCALALSMSQIASLALEIRQFLELRKKCFPEDNFKPKHEFLEHYPKLMELFGPLKHLRTLRFESKHGEFKKQVKHIQNFKNLTQRLAYKHQLKQASIDFFDRFKHDTYAEAEKFKKYNAQNSKDDAINEAIKNCFEGSHDEKFISEKVKFLSPGWRTTTRYECILIFYRSEETKTMKILKTVTLFPSRILVFFMMVNKL